VFRHASNENPRSRFGPWDRVSLGWGPILIMTRMIQDGAEHGSNWLWSSKWGSFH